MSTEPRKPRRAPDPSRPFVLGLVGRAGSGKTTIAEALAEDGARIIEADRIGHEVTHDDPEVRAALVAEYGAAVYRDDGTLDRPQVARRVFRDADARARLDRLTHPRIMRRIVDRIEGWRDDGFRGVVVVDAALLLEWGLERECQAVMAVVAPPAARLARLAAARGWSHDEAERRLAAQREDAAYAAAADVTLDNAGTRAELVIAARAALVRLRTGRRDG